MLEDTGFELTQELIDALNRKGRGRRERDDPTDKFLRDLHYAGVPAPELEYRFHPTRKWALDFAWPRQLVAVELEGLVYSNRGDNQLVGRHVSVTGFKADIAKYGAAFSMGWNVLRITASDARSGVAVGWLLEHFKRKD